MELDNKKLTNIVIVMLIVCVLHIGFTVWSYRLLRNKRRTTRSYRTKRT